MSKIKIYSRNNSKFGDLQFDSECDSEIMECLKGVTDGIKFEFVNVGEEKGFPIVGLITASGLFESNLNLLANTYNIEGKALTPCKYFAVYFNYYKKGDIFYSAKQINSPVSYFKGAPIVSNEEVASYIEKTGNTDRAVSINKLIDRLSNAISGIVTREEPTSIVPAQSRNVVVATDELADLLNNLNLELADLDGKINRLKKFIAGPKFPETNPVQGAFLMEQFKAMNDYRNCLDIRIADLESNINKID